MMRYSLGNLREWMPVGEGELVTFPIGDAKVRTVQFDALCDGPTGFFATKPFTGVADAVVEAQPDTIFERTWLVGFCPGGEVSIRFAVSSDVSVYCQLEEGRSVFLRFGQEAQVIPARDGAASFVNLSPRVAGPADELRRMMRVAELNRRQREAAMQAELDRLSALVDQRAAEGASVPSGTSGTPEAAPPSTVPSSEKV